MYFQEPGVADAELDGDPAPVPAPNDGRADRIRRSAAGADGYAAGPAGFIERLPEPDGLPDWISQEELDRYITEFSRTGFTGGLNWYRNFDRNWETTARTRRRQHLRAGMFIGGTADPVLSFTRADRAPKVTGRTAR